MAGTFSEHHLEKHGVEQPWAGRHRPHGVTASSHLTHCARVWRERAGRASLENQGNSHEAWITAPQEILLPAGCRPCPPNFPSLQPLIAAVHVSFWTQRHCCCLTWHELHDFVEITAVHRKSNYSIIMEIQSASEESRRNPAVNTVTETSPSTERFIHLQMVRGWLLRSDTACLHLSALWFHSQVLLT